MADEMQGVIRNVLQRLLQLVEELVPLDPRVQVVGGPFDWIKGSLADMIKSIIAPPDIDDGPALRAWLLKVSGWLQQAADWTSTSLDNTAVALAMKLVADDALWPDLYALIHSLPHDCEPNVMMDSPDVQAIAARLGEKVGVDPFTIVSIVLAIVRIIVSLRK